MIKYAQRISVVSVISAGIAILANTVMGYETIEAVLLGLSITAGSGINSIKEYFMIQSYADKYSSRRYYTYQLSMGALISLVSIPGAQLILQGMGADPTVKPEPVLVELFVIYWFFQEILDTYLKNANIQFYKRENISALVSSSVYPPLLSPFISPYEAAAFSTTPHSSRGHAKAYWKTVIQLAAGKGILGIGLSLLVRYPITHQQEIWHSLLFGISYMSYSLTQIGKDYAIVETTTGKISRSQAGKMWLVLSLLRSAIAGPLAALVATGLHFTPNIGLPIELVTFLNKNIVYISAAAFSIYTLIDQLLNNTKQAAKLDLVTDELYARRTLNLFFELDAKLRFRAYVRKSDGTYYFGKHMDY